MGRKKITITRIQDERNRQITFSKRKAGLLKKAYELSILCDVEIAVIMITSNKKLYQYASSNMNSILIRYTEFKDPDESKTNADILDDITKKEKGGGGQDESGEEDSGHSNFLVTPHTQESYRKIDEEFDTLLRQNQIPQQPVQAHGIQTPLGSAPASIPAVMPVSVPVSSTNTVHRQIHQHLKGQLETQKSSGSSAGPLSSASSGSLFSPQSDLSSASPAIVVGNKTGQKSPMPPPQNTPTRLQMIRNQTLKLHLPGSGRNYISLPGPGSSKSATEEGVADSPEDPMGEEPDGKDEGAGGGGEKGGRLGSKPQLRVYIPGQKEFVPRTQATSPLAQVGLNNAGGGASEAAGAEGGGGGGGGMGQAPAIANQTTTSTESLTTPILSLATPNMFSSLPPLFSSFMGDFPFGQIPGGASAGGGAGGGGASAMGAAGGGHPGGASGDGGSAALVAFPVSIQPSASGQGMGNLVLQAQNMGQPFLLTPTYDRTQHPLTNTSQGGPSGGGHGAPPPPAAPPPPSSLASAPSISPNMMKDLEQLKQQYERTTQLIQQQLFFSQMTSMMQQQQQHQQQQQQNQPPQNDIDVGGGGGGPPNGPPGGGGGAAGGQLEGTGSQGAAGHSVGGVGSSGAPPAGASVSPLGASRDTRGGGGGGGLGSQESDAEAQANQFINGSDVMISSRSQSDSLLRRTARDVGELDSEDLAASKRPRLDTSVSAL